MSVDVYIRIVYIMPTIGGYVLFFVCVLALQAQGRGAVCQLMFELVLYISCQQLGGGMSVGVYVSIVYIMPTIGEYA